MGARLSNRKLVEHLRTGLDIQAIEAALNREAITSKSAAPTTVRRSAGGSFKDAKSVGHSEDPVDG
jgi:DNA polymerase III gamma/tau subunit